jgi:hypothetical protein
MEKVGIVESCLNGDELELVVGLASGVFFNVGLAFDWNTSYFESAKTDAPAPTHGTYNGGRS